MVISLGDKPRTLAVFETKRSSDNNVDAQPEIRTVPVKKISSSLVIIFLFLDLLISTRGASQHESLASRDSHLVAQFVDAIAKTAAVQKMCLVDFIEILLIGQKVPDGDDWWRHYLRYLHPLSFHEGGCGSL